MKCVPGLLATLAFITSIAGAEPILRERSPLNSGWRFRLDDPVGSDPDQFAYERTRPWLLPATVPFRRDPASVPAMPQGTPGQGLPVIQTSFDDGDWRQLDLPHDWAIEGPFRQEYPESTGKLRYWGPAWYRRHLTWGETDHGRRCYLDIDGAMSNALVWCNGKFVGGWPYGYSSFRLDLTPFLLAGSDNVVAIRLDQNRDSSRWYPGAGIYRNVWLVKTGPVHVAQWGTCVRTPAVSPQDATVEMAVRIDNRGGQAVRATVSTAILAEGRAVAAIAEQSIDIPAGKSGESRGSTNISDPRLWHLDAPFLHTAVTTVSIDGKEVDRYETPFGIRRIDMTPEHGVQVNGRRVRIQGVCNHHDLGALGSAFNTRAAERQLELLKEMGVNALRTSHNMPAPELLDLCDRMGILVMDESFDCWAKSKTPGDYARLFADWHEPDLRAEVRRDRNHPSIFMWSIGNEVLELDDAVSGPAIAGWLSRIIQEEDPTRPSVIGSNNGKACSSGVQDAVGVMGQNYQNGGYARFAAEHPRIPLVGSETSSCISTRGVYVFQTPEQVAAANAAEVRAAAAKGRPAPTPRPFTAISENKADGQADFQMSSYDLYAPEWGWVPDKEFAALDSNPHVLGEFVWTGFDYLGEPTPYNGDATNLLNFTDPLARERAAAALKDLGRIPVPSRSSYFGILDLAGFKKDRFWLYQSRWRPELPMAHLLPHWTWPERTGMVTPVHLYTSGDEAELFLNGRSLGRKRKGPYEYRLRWDDVLYAPGEVKAVAYKGGKPWAEDVVRTADAAQHLTMAADRAAITPDGRDLAFVTVSVQDRAGTFVPRAGNTIRFSLAGPGELIAVDNGDPTSHAPFRSTEVKAFNGLALAIVRFLPAASGTLTLTAEADGLTPSRTVIQAR